MYRFLLLVFLGLWSVGLTSCSKPIGSDELEQKHPSIVEARALVRQQDVLGAERLLLDALREQPDLALAHVELGILYQSQDDTIASLYHYQNYLILRPRGSKAALVREVITGERKRLVTEYGTGSPPATGEGDSEVVLKQSLEAAKQRIAELEVALEQAQRQRPRSDREEAGQGTPSGPSSEETVSSTTGSELEPQTFYVVQPGDTLSRIAEKTYGRSSQWTRIYEANRDVIPNKNVLSPGTQLVLP